MAGLSEIAATTYEYREKSLADAVTDNDPFMYLMKKEGNIVEVPGGREIWEDFMGFQNAYYQAIDATEEIALGYNQTITGFQYSPKIAVIPVVINALERAQNQGQAEFKNLLKTRLKVGEATMQNNIESDLQGDGTGRGGKAFAGIKSYIVRSTSSGSIGGIARASVSSIRNVAVDAPATYTGATSAANIESRLRSVKNQLLRNNDMPKFCLAGSSYYNFAGDALASKQRFTTVQNDLVEGGFENIAIEGMAMVLANGKVFSGLTRIATDECFLLNVKYFKLRMYKGYNMQPLPERVSVNQLVDVSITAAIGQFTTNNPALSGVMYDS